MPYARWSHAPERQALGRRVQVLSAEAADTTGREFIVGPSRVVTRF